MKNFFTILILYAVLTQSFWAQINQNESAKREVFQIEQNLTLKENQSIFIEPQSQTKKNDIDEIINGVISNINVDSIMGYIQHLQNYGSRFMLNPNRFEISEWIKDKFLSFGFTDVKFDTFYAATSFHDFGIDVDTMTIQRNVVATLPGSTNPEKVYIFCGHYDSFNQSIDIMNTAPGADDDASGTSAALEIARAFKADKYQPEFTIKFIALAAEELMYFGDAGSEHYATLAYNQGMEIQMVNNHDMIAYTPVPLENSYVNIGWNPGSEYLSSLGVTCANNYTSINANPYGYAGADLITFNYYGYKGIYFEEAVFSPFYHTSDDVIENYNWEFCAEVIKTSCATTLAAMILPAPVDNICFSDLEDGTRLKINWEADNLNNFDHFNIYVGTQSGVYDRTVQSTETSVIVDNLESGTEFYFGVSVVNANGYESFIIEGSYIPFTFTFDKGILIVDETFNGNGSLMNPSDEEVDSFFDNVLNDFSCSNYDLVQNPNIAVNNIGEYSTIIWHKNDYTSNSVLTEFRDNLARYLNAGGNFLYAGYLPSKFFEENTAYPNTFNEGSFIYDYFGIESVNQTFGSRFIGAITNSTNYPSVYVDSSKTSSATNYHLRNIESISTAKSTNSIYLYDTFFEPGTPGGSMVNEIVGVENIDETFNAVALSFPLYYMKQNQAKELLSYILTEKFNEITSSFSSEDPAIYAYQLKQNYPNPFNPVTTIGYSLPEDNFVSLKVYNIIGKLVKELVRENQKAGLYSIQFSGDNLPSGVYLYSLEAGNFRQSKKMILLK